MFRGKKYRNQKHSRTYLDEADFYQGTNMAQAAAEVSAFSNRAQAIFPPGSQPPFILRFDASTLPVGQLVLSRCSFK
jgi:multidrug efflux pump subunit AcrB